MAHNGSFIRDFAEESKKWLMKNELEIVRQKEASLLIKWLEYILKNLLSSNVKIYTESVSSTDGKTKNEKALKVDGKKIYSYSIIKQPTSLTNTVFINSLIKPILFHRLSSYINSESYLVKISFVKK